MRPAQTPTFGAVNGNWRCGRGPGALQGSAQASVPVTRLGQPGSSGSGPVRRGDTQGHLPGVPACLLTARCGVWRGSVGAQHSPARDLQPCSQPVDAAEMAYG